MASGRRTRRSERAKLDATPPWDERPREEAEPTTGPWDEADKPEDDLERLDLGALQIPVIGGVEVRVDVSPEGQVAAATLSYGGSEMQVGVFAAPRTAGIWDEVRKEIRGSIASQGGTAQDERGRFGFELTARVPAQGGYQTVRFVGVDGPRWFLRALFTGQGATDPARAAALEDALRNIVVIRGTDPMPVRDPLPLRLPKDVAEQAAKETGLASLAPPAPGDAPTRPGDTPPARRPSGRRRR
ncbi:MAG: hypothetical protein V7637_345 [Mycobacteriales bacterium]|jgi:hypothetical protein